MTKIEKEILEVIIEYIEEHQYPPTIKEITDMVDLSSTSSVHRHIKAMIEKGFLETDAEDRAQRAIRVPGYKLVKENDNV